MHFVRKLRTLFLTNGQLLTFFYFVAEEQCCRSQATAHAKRVGGYRVGFRQQPY